MAVQKTNAMRILDKNKINYEVITYDISDDKIDGISVAEKTGQDVKEVYKTLVTQGASREFYVFVIPVDKELDLKIKDEFEHGIILDDELTLPASLEKIEDNIAKVTIHQGKYHQIL